MSRTSAGFSTFVRALFDMSSSVRPPPRTFSVAIIGAQAQAIEQFSVISAEIERLRASGRLPSGFSGSRAHARPGTARKHRGKHAARNAYLKVLMNFGVLFRY